MPGSPTPPKWSSSSRAPSTSSSPTRTRRGTRSTSRTSTRGSSWGAASPPTTSCRRWRGSASSWTTSRPVRTTTPRSTERAVRGSRSAARRDRPAAVFPLLGRRGAVEGGVEHRVVADLHGCPREERSQQREALHEQPREGGGRRPSPQAHQVGEAGGECALFGTHHRHYVGLA